MMWLLLTSALADQALVADTGYCAQPIVQTLLPVEGQADVAVDARLLALFSDGCVPPVGFVTLVGPGQEEIMSDEEVGGSSITNRISIQSVVPLEADSTYWLYVQDQTGGSREVTFTTGSEQAEVIDEAPTGTITSLSYEHERNAETGTWRATVILDHHPVDSGLSILRVTDSRTPQVIIDETWATSSGTVTWELEWWGAEEEELCLEITQEDEAGRDSEPSNEICSEAEISRTSCSSAAIGSVGSWWLLAGLVGLARRRRAS